jgi:hypothetical protein
MYIQNLWLGFSSETSTWCQGINSGSSYIISRCYNNSLLWDVVKPCVRLFHFHISSPLNICIRISLKGTKSHVLFTQLADFCLLFVKAEHMKPKQGFPCNVRFMFLLPPLAYTIFTKLCYVMYHYSSTELSVLSDASGSCRFLWRCL